MAFMMPISRRRSRMAITSVFTMPSDATASARLPKTPRNRSSTANRRCRSARGVENGERAEAHLLDFASSTRLHARRVFHAHVQRCVGRRAAVACCRARRRAGRHARPSANFNGRNTRAAARSAEPSGSRSRTPTIFSAGCAGRPEYAADIRRPRRGALGIGHGELLARPASWPDPRRPARRSPRRLAAAVQLAGEPLLENDLGRISDEKKLPCMPSKASVVLGRLRERQHRGATGPVFVAQFGRKANVGKDFGYVGYALDLLPGGLIERRGFLGGRQRCSPRLAIEAAADPARE